MTLAEIRDRVLKGSTVPCVRAGHVWCAYGVGTDDHLQIYGMPSLWKMKARKVTCPRCLETLGISWYDGLQMERAARMLGEFTYRVYRDVKRRRYKLAHRSRR